MWQDYMVPLIRAEVNDLGTTQRFTDLEYKKKLVVSARQVQDMASNIAPFTYTYTFTIDTGDGTTWDISPDPIDTSTDEDFVNLWTLRVLCSDARSGLISASSNAIKIKDGDSSIDTSAGFGGYKELLSGAGGPCAGFQSAWKEYIFRKQDGNRRLYINAGTDYFGPSYVHMDRS